MYSIKHLEQWSTVRSVKPLVVRLVCILCIYATWTFVTDSNLRDNGLPKTTNHTSRQNSLGERNKTSLEFEQERRQATLRDICKKYPELEQHPDVENMAYILSDENHHVLYANVAKVASTSWVNMMLYLSGKVKAPLTDTSVYQWKFTNRDFLRNAGLKYMDTLTKSEALRRISNYFSFVFVRNPFERILSAYKDRFCCPGKELYHKEFGRAIIHRYRKNATAKAIATGSDVTFPEFVSYLVDMKVRASDVHWRPAHMISHVCAIPYTYIGKMETFDVDSEHVLRHGFRIKVPPKFANQMHNRSKAIGENIRYYTGIPTAHIKQLRKIYAKDFELFGYDWDIPGLT